MVMQVQLSNGFCYLYVRDYFKITNINAKEGISDCILTNSKLSVNVWVKLITIDCASVSWDKVSQ